MAKILIIEDYLDLQVFFVMFLKMNGYDVESAASKKEAYTILETFSPDLILLDVILDVEDGRNICKEIKEKNKSISIILLSANYHFLKDYYSSNADDIIEKPFENVDLLNKIKLWLNKKGL